MSIDNFITIPCEDPALAGIISHYYFHWSDAQNEILEFLYYPHYKHGLTAYYKDDPYPGAQLKQPKNQVWTFFSRQQKDATLVQMEAPYYKLGVVFETLGMNHFIKGDLASQYPESFSTISIFEKQWDTIVSGIWNKPISARGEILDQFFKQLNPDFKQKKFLSLLRTIVYKPDDLSLSQMAVRLNVSEKTVTRLFSNHVGCSFSNFKKIARFRRALKAFRDENPTNLTELAFLAQYYDQPNFNKNIKAMSGQKPSRFFKQVEQLESDTFWTFQ